jgi:hypothetical protein
VPGRAGRMVERRRYGGRACAWPYLNNTESGQMQGGHQRRLREEKAGGRAMRTVREGTRGVPGQGGTRLAMRGVCQAIPASRQAPSNAWPQQEQVRAVCRHRRAAGGNRKRERGSEDESCAAAAPPLPLSGNQWAPEWLWTLVHP